MTFLRKEEAQQQLSWNSGGTSRAGPPLCGPAHTTPHHVAPYGPESAVELSVCTDVEHQ